MKKIFNALCKVIGITSIVATAIIGSIFAIQGIQTSEWLLVLGAILCVIMIIVLIKIFIIDEIKKHR